MATFDPNNNFFRFWCEITQQWQYRAGCQKRLQAIAAGDNDLMSAFPECVDAHLRGRCKATGMTLEEVSKGATIYYRDRDDAGPGIMRRKEPRSDKDRAAHHILLAALEIEADESKTVHAAIKLTQPSRKAAAPEPAEPVNAFDLSALINADVAKLNQENARG